MNSKRPLKSITHALAAVSLLTLLGSNTPSFASQAHGVSSAPMSAIGADDSVGPDSLAPKNAKGYWTCPMHPEIHAHEPGKCPVCKMKLFRLNPKNV